MFTWVFIQLSASLIAIKQPGLIHNFLHKKMLESSHEYDSCYLFVCFVWAIDFAIWFGTYLFEFSSEFSIVVIYLFLVMSSIKFNLFASFLSFINFKVIRSLSTCLLNPCTFLLASMWNLCKCCHSSLTDIVFVLSVVNLLLAGTCFFHFSWFCVLWFSNNILFTFTRVCNLF